MSQIPMRVQCSSRQPCNVGFRVLSGYMCSIWHLSCCDACRVVTFPRIVMESYNARLIPAHASARVAVQVKDAITSPASFDIFTSSVERLEA